MLGTVDVETCPRLGTSRCLLAAVIVFLSVFVVDVVHSQDNSFVDGSNGSVILSLKYYNPFNQSLWKIFTLGGLSEAVVNVQAAPSDVKFYTFQAHSHLYNISLSYNQTLTPHYNINGTNLGLVWKTKSGQGVFYVSNPNPQNVTVMLAVVAYGTFSPVPGGCNMEFDVEIAPYLKLWHTDAIVEVNAQPALNPQSSCAKDSVAYEVYRMYMAGRDFSEDSYFSAIKSMLTPADILANGTLAPVPIYGSIMRRLYSLYAGTGSVYVVVAKSLTGVSAYVPAVSYGCSAISFTDSCSVLDTTFSKVLCACVLFLGFFACFYGHSFFKTQVFLSGFLTGSLLAYTGFAQLTSLPYGSGVTLSCAVGMAAGVACLLFWCFCGIPVIAILMLVLPLGLLLASLVFYIGLGDLDFAQLDLDYWLTFLLLVLTVLLVLTPMLQHASIVSCAVVGAYAAVVPFDHYAGGNLKYIVINTLRRASVAGFSQAILDPPFQATDGILVALWFVLAVIGARVQQIRQAGRPPFPPGRRRRGGPGGPPETAPLLGQGGARTAVRVSSRIPYSYGSVGDDDVFETPPAPPAPPPRAGQAQQAQQAQQGPGLADWLGRGCGLRGR